jgi:propanediol dehydratase large subunit
VSESRRAASRAGRDVHKETLVSPAPPLGLVALAGPSDPEPTLVVEDGRVAELDGRPAAEFDVIDRFIAAHGLDLEVAAEAMALPELELARRAVSSTSSVRGPSWCGFRAA